MKLLGIIIGAMLGGPLRYMMEQAVSPTLFHLSLITMVVNLSGCLLAGGLFAVEEMTPIPEPLHLGLRVGFLGAYTTMSSFLWQVSVGMHIAPMIAIAYGAISLLLGWICCMVAASSVRWGLDRTSIIRSQPAKE